MYFDQFDLLPADARFSAFLTQALEDRQGTFEEEMLALSRTLGFKRPQTVLQWIRGTAKVPIHHLVPLSQYLHFDLSRTLPLWISAEAAQCDDGQLYLAAKRCLSVWEFGLVHVARDIYGRYDAEEDRGFADDDD